jgi:negative regulator of sigma E activity
MNNEPTKPDESLWRRRLSGTERAALRARPEQAAEARLTEALAKLPAAPVASNFTARVMAAIEREEQAAARTKHHWSWRFLFPRVAVSAAVLLFAGISIQRYESNTAHHQAMVRAVAIVAQSSKTMPSADALENMDVIQRISQSAHADGDLLADLQP